MDDRRSDVAGQRRTHGGSARTPISVLVVDAEWWWREALLRVLERCPQPFAPLAAAPDSARRLVGQRRPDVAIVDIDEAEGAELLLELREQEEIPCLALVSELTSAKLTAALSVAASFVVKQELDPERLCELVLITQAGDALLLRANRRMLSELVLRDTETPAQRCGLTAREADVVGLLAQGLSNVEIASTLHLSDGHVKKLVSRAMRRLGVRNRTEAALVARREGIVPESQLTDVGAGARR